LCRKESLFLLRNKGRTLFTKETALKDMLSKGKMLLNPVEPLNKPKVLTQYLLGFGRALVIEPKGAKKIFRTFPIEIAVYISQKGDFEVFDILTLTRQKFTLYGEPRNGFK
jgi:hypothetical protein